MENTTDAVAAADAALDRVVQLQAQIDALSAQRAEELLAFDEAFARAYPPSAAALRERAERAELACAMRLPERAAENLLGEAKMLVRDLPATHAALSRGSFSYRHAQVLIEETAGLDADDRAAIERLALGSASTTTVTRFRRMTRALRERRCPASMRERTRAAFADRALTLDPARDGMAYLTLYTRAVEAAAIYDRAVSAATRISEEGDPRTLVQLRVDLAVDALLSRDSTLGLGPTMREEMHAGIDELVAVQQRDLGAFAGIIPTVVVTVPVQTLLGGSAPGTLDGVGPIDPETARKLTAQAPQLYRLLTDRESGVALSLSRTTYRVPEPLRRWLRLRDGTCRFPMCGIGAHRCDLDHTIDWARDGTTDHDNLAHLSRGHHTLKHHGGWSVRRVRDGSLEWRSFLGRHYDTHPEAA